MPKKVIILLADGFEEVEAVTPIDYLRRAGIELTTAAIGKSRTVKGSHGVPVNADTTLEELAGQGLAGAALWDGVLLPGGMPGASNLAASPETGAFLKEMAGAGRIVAAICASPALVLAPLGLLSGRCFTCFPGMEGKVSGDAKWTQDKVAVDGNIITSRAAGTAAAWAIALIEKLLDAAAAQKIASSVLL